MSNAVMQTNLPFPVRRGKVRDVYDLGETLLIVSTDRLSAFDVVMEDPIPGKGKVLTALSLFWFEMFGKKIEHHLLASEVCDFPQQLKGYREQLDGRSMLVRKAKVVPIECICRGYLAGSGWKEYQKSQTVCRISLPAGLKLCDKLPKALFTPSTKAEEGHDENISPAEAAKIVGTDVAKALEEKTLLLYTSAADYARTKGVIIADTKFEFGQMADGRIILVDEILTPDSSRFWPADEYKPGQDQPSFDKQFVRNYLEAQPWNKTAPAPRLPKEVIEGTQKRYLEAYRRLTGKELAMA
jgi:phosphoribosylaminoimidazole-succinocarboxamide synthase